jgi:hypothetical protein
MNVVTKLLLLSCLVFGLYACNSSKISDKDLKSFEVAGNVRQIIYVEEDPKRNSEVYFSDNGAILYEKYQGQNLQYNYEDKQLTMLKIYSSLNSITAKRKYIYTDDLLIEIREFDSQNSYQKRVCYKYDSNKNMLRGDLLSAYNDTLYSWQYTYSATNKMLTERNTSRSDGGFEKNIKYLYDSLDNIAEIQEFEGEKELLKKRKFTQFNNFPLQTKMFTYWAGDIIDSTMYEYKFDKKGNWISRESIPLQGRKLITKRTILYY